MLAAMPAFSPPPRFGGYEVRELLGKGGMAHVFRGEHVLLQRAVAIKFLHHHLAASDASQQRFVREARLVARLSHPNIVTVFDFGQLDDGTYYQASELVAGSTLREYLRQGPLAPDRALGFARQLAEGLGSAHALGVIHRDLKPSNVMVVPDATLADGFRLKLLDFGIAKSLEPEAEITETGVSIGTPGYMSPEQCRARSEIGPATDIYSLGVVLYVMLCGAPPFAAGDGGDLLDLHVNAPPPRPSARCGCSPAIDALVLHCLAKAPAARPPTMADVIAAIDRIPPAERTVAERAVAVPLDDGPHTLPLPADPISGGEASTTTVLRPAQPQPQPAMTTVPRPQPPPRRRWLLRAAIAAAGILLGTGVALLAGPPGSEREVANEPSAPAAAPPVDAALATLPPPARVAPVTPSAPDATGTRPEPSAPGRAADPEPDPPTRAELSHDRSAAKVHKATGRVHPKPATKPPSSRPPPDDRSFERPVP